MTGALRWVRWDRAGVVGALWVAVAATHLLTPISVHHIVFLVAVGAQSLSAAWMVASRRGRLSTPMLWVWVAIAMGLTAVTGFLEGVGAATQSPSVDASAIAGSALSLMCYGVFSAYVVFPLASVAMLRMPTLSIFGGFFALAMAHVWIVTDRPRAQLVVLFAIAALSAAVTLVSVVLAGGAYREVGRSAEPLLGWAAFTFGSGQLLALGLQLANVDSTVRYASIITANGLILAALASKAGHLVGTRVVSLSDQERRPPASAIFVVFVLGDTVLVELSRTGYRLGWLATLALGLFFQAAMVSCVVLALLRRGSWGALARSYRVAWRVRRAIDRDQLDYRLEPVVRIGNASVWALRVVPDMQTWQRSPVSVCELVDAARRTRRLIAMDEMMILRAAEERAHLVRESSDRAPLVSVRLASDGIDLRSWSTQLVEKIRDSGVVPAGLAIEIPSSYVSNDWDAMALTVRELRALGVLVAVVDYGADLANFTLLSRVDFDILGFHAQFVELTATTERGATIAAAAIDVAKSVGTLVVASGVNDLSWVPRLRQLGFDFVAGAKPNSIAHWPIAEPEPTGGAPTEPSVAAHLEPSQ